MIFIIAVSTICLSKRAATDTCGIYLSSVQNAIDEASDGDTIIMAGGSVTWKSSLIIDKPIVLRGSNTTINNSTSDSAVITVKCGNFAISGIIFNCNSLTIAIYVKAEARNFRIHDCMFKEAYSRAIFLDGGRIEGLIDNNIFLNCGPSDIAVYADNSEAWQRPPVLGASLGKAALYVEDNSFIYDGKGNVEHAIASNDGARYVFRHNTIRCKIRTSSYQLGSAIDAHGNCASGRGTISVEIYHNKIEVDAYRAIYIRGGSGVIFGNTISGNIDYPIHLTNYRSWIKDFCKGNATCGERDYPCPDQINNLYIWNNTLNGLPIVAKVDDRGLNKMHIKEGRDFYHIPKPDYKEYVYPHPSNTAAKDTIASKLRTAPVNVNK